MTDRTYTDETLNAFVDGELELDEAVEILRASEDNDEVRTRLCELRYLKDMVAHAYSQVPRAYADPVSASPRPAKNLVRTATAAAMVAMMAVGIGIGWVSHDRETMHTVAVPDDPVFLDISEVFSLQEAKSAHGKPSSIILHVATNDRHRVEDALAKLEAFVDAQQLDQKRVAVEIVANGYGLDLIRTAHTPYENQVKQLARDDYVTILACRQAVQRLRDRGIDVDLIPEADFAPSALDRIIERLREGWVYVKV